MTNQNPLFNRVNTQVLRNATSYLQSSGLCEVTLPDLLQSYAGLADGRRKADAMEADLQALRLENTDLKIKLRQSIPIGDAVVFGKGAKHWYDVAEKHAIKLEAEMRYSIDLQDKVRKLDQEINRLKRELARNSSDRATTILKEVLNHFSMSHKDRDTKCLQYTPDGVGCSALDDAFAFFGMPRPEFPPPTVQPSKNYERAVQLLGEMVRHTKPDGTGCFTTISPCISRRDAQDFLGSIGKNRDGWVG